MTISAPITQGEQITLWSFVGNRALASPAEARPFIGAFFEEATRMAFGATRHQIDSTRDYCPDLSVGSRDYLEVKSIGNSRRGLIYADRLERDRKLVRGGARLTYVFWLHNTRTADCTMLHDLRRSLAADTVMVLVVPFERLSRACRKIEPRIISPQHINRPAYPLPWAVLDRLGHGRSSFATSPAKVYGCNLKAVPVHGPDLSRCMPVMSKVEREAATQLHAEMCEHRLAVELAPAPQAKHVTHQVRVVVGENPTWYRRLASKTARHRRVARRRNRSDTDLRRPLVERALLRLADTGRPRFPYDFQLLPIVRAAAAC